MQKEISLKLVVVTFGVLAASFLAAFYAAGWTEPAVAPPGGNAAVPLNVSGTGQAKAGGLTLNTGGAAVGLIVEQGNVGIGTTTPGYKLDVGGIVNADDFYKNGAPFSAGSWTQSGNYLYPNDLNWLVGIGRNPTSYALEVNGVIGLYSGPTLTGMFGTLGGESYISLSSNGFLGIGGGSFNGKSLSFAPSTSAPSTNGTIYYDSSVDKFKCYEGWSWKDCIGGGGGGGGLGGGGTANYVAKFTSASSLGDSLIYDNGTNVGIKSSSPAFPLDVNGDINGLRLCINGDCRDAWPSGGGGGVTSVNGATGIITAPSTGDVSVSLDSTYLIGCTAAANKKIVWSSGDSKLGCADDLIGGAGSVANGTEANQTLRWSGSNWVGSSVLKNNDSDLTVKSGSRLYMGSGLYMDSANIYKVSAIKNLSGDLNLEASGDVVVVNDLRVGEQASIVGDFSALGKSDIRIKEVPSFTAGSDFMEDMRFFRIGSDPLCDDSLDVGKIRVGSLYDGFSNKPAICFCGEFNNFWNEQAGFFTWICLKAGL